MNAIRMESLPCCIICGDRGVQVCKDLPDKLFGVPGLFNFRYCNDCKLIWLDPRPVLEDIPRCYENYYTHVDIKEGTSGARERPLASLRDALRLAILCGYYGYHHLHEGHVLCRFGPILAKMPFLRYRAVYDDLRERFPHYCDESNALLVDVGCGRGDYLKRMQDLGWRVLGIEPDSNSAARAERRGIPVFTGTLEAAKLPEGSADHITMQHVIEHLPDPVTTINECFRILKKGGRLVIYTPNNESLGYRVFRESWLALDPPRHFFIFSSKCMALLFEKSSFKKYRINTVSVSARKIYDNSFLISRFKKIDGKEPVKQQRGRTLFALKETLLCYVEIEAIAYKL
jgi:SAM-dependent methyltransferase